MHQQKRLVYIFMYVYTYEDIKMTIHNQIQDKTIKIKRHKNKLRAKRRIKINTFDKNLLNVSMYALVHMHINS